MADQQLSVSQRVHARGADILRNFIGEKGSAQRVTTVTRAAKGVGLLHAAHKMGIIGGHPLLGVALGLIHQKMSEHAARLGAEQKQFETNAKISRGDFDGLTHKDLRNIAANPAKFGGPHSNEIAAAAHGEMQRREAVLNPSKHLAQQVRDARNQTALAKHQSAAASGLTPEQVMKKKNDELSAEGFKRNELKHENRKRQMTEMAQHKQSLREQYGRPAAQPRKPAVPAAAAQPKAAPVVAPALHMGVVTTHRGGRTVKVHRMVRYDDPSQRPRPGRAANRPTAPRSQ